MNHGLNETGAIISITPWLSSRLSYAWGAHYNWFSPKVLEGCYTVHSFMNKISIFSLGNYLLEKFKFQSQLVNETCKKLHSCCISIDGNSLQILAPFDICYMRYFLYSWWDGAGLNEPASMELNETVYYPRYLIYHVRYLVWICDETSFYPISDNLIWYKTYLKRYTRTYIIIYRLVQLRTC